MYELKTLQCIGACLRYFYLDGDQKACTDTCSKYVNSGFRCVDSCEKDESYLAAYDNALHCSAQCHMYCFVLQSDQFHKLCVDECVGDTPYFIKIDLLYTQCMSYCPENYLIDDYQCVKHCQFYMVESGNKMVCAKSCPQYYKYTNYGNQCIEACLGETPYRSGSECVSVCPYKIYD